MLTKKEFQALSDFRYELRRFLRFSEQAVTGGGITTLQYLLLLHTKGYRGRDWAIVGELAERLQTHHHGVVALVTRCEKLGLVKRKAGMEDRRRVEVHLTAKGERCVGRLALLHRNELKSLRSTFVVPSVNRPSAARSKSNVSATVGLAAHLVMG